MSLIQFENLPSTNTPINAANLNNNFNELNQDSGWQTLTIATGFTTLSWNNLKVRKKNGVVYVMGGVVPTTTTSWEDIITTLPSGFRPNNEIDVVCRTEYNQVMKIVIGSNGEIKTLNLNDGTGLPANNAILINATFLAD